MTAARWKWIALGALVVGLFAAWRVLPLGQWLKDFQAWIEGLGPLGGVLFGLAYVVGALLFVPGAVLTIGAGYLFGLGWGVVVVSLASTAAAALAFLIARHLARERVETLARKNPKFAALDRAIGKNDWKVIFLLRLSPLIPFSISNYLYGLTSVRFAPYVLASWIGMLPGTFLYVYLGAAGKSLGEKQEKSPWEWALLGAGLLATIAVTVILTRVAKKELGKTSS
ncbi:MAG: TVP38/TMEM64 family protein [Thermoanaerobaculia bacterium]